VDQSSPDIFQQTQKTSFTAVRISMLDILRRSEDIRDQTLKWYKSTEISHVLAPNFLEWEPPKFLDMHYKCQLPIMWQTFTAIGRGTSENAWRKRKHLQ